jgi:hypothetical protein
MIEPFNELEWITSYFDNAVNLEPETLDRVRNFTLLWNLFEAFGCKKNANIPDIKKLVVDINERQPITRELVNPYLDYFADRYINHDGTNKEVFAGLSFRDTNGDNNAKEFVRQILAREIDTPVEILQSLLIIIYRFRNNLFHGQKQVIYLNGQLSNFTTANSLLAKVLTIMKDNYLI